MIIYNCHTHIFNLECVPDRFLNHPGLYRLLQSNRVTGKLVELLMRSEVDFLKKQAQFLKYNSEDWQELIFTDLQKQYPTGTKFVVLTMDMDHMGAGTAKRNYLTQIHEVAELKKLYPNTLIPFLAIDPRRSGGKELKEFARKQIEGKGFHGLKLYTPLGFFPFDEKLDDLYSWASEKQIPLLFHCHQGGGVYYKGEIKTEWLNPHPGLEFTKTPMKLFRDNFMHPDCFEILLKKHPRLKFCLAHFGGTYEMEKPSADNWYHRIKRMISRPENNVFTDVSYSLWNTKHHGKIKEAVADPACGSRIMFGTDFYMTEREKPEKILYGMFRAKMGEELFGKCSYGNVKQFLQSEYYAFNG
ncbi:MAG: amidohydrolase family protein [Bacteroidia bacterium]|nr:amidohydrolase family protein [Bacteroidia bacterium]